MPEDALVCVGMNRGLLDVHAIRVYYDGAAIYHENDDCDQPLVVDRSITRTKVVLSEVDVEAYFEEHPDGEVRYLDCLDRNREYVEAIRARVRRPIPPSSPHD